MEEEQWTFLDTNVTIVNRKKSYQIPKQKLSSIPYFMKLFSDSNCDTTKIELDLDESSFDNIVDFILNGHLSISMESALSMMELVNYLGMGEIKQKYYDFYRSNFNIGILEDYLVFYEKRNLPRMFDEEKLNSFIGKYFLPISNTRAFLKFSVSLLERILKLRLVVSYEYQIVEAINRWIKFNEEDRKQYLSKLIELVNFCHLKDSEMEDVTAKLKSSGIDIQSSPRIHSSHACHPECCQLDCKSTRHSYKSLIAIYELDENKIEIRRLFKSNLWIKYGQFTRDETISSSLIEADHILDIIFDSGRKGIRVDLIGKKFKYLKMFGDENSYYDQAHKYITHDIPARPYCSIIKNSRMELRHEAPSVNLQRVESIFLEDHLGGIFDVHGDTIRDEQPHGLMDYYSQYIGTSRFMQFQSRLNKPARPCVHPPNYNSMDTRIPYSKPYYYFPYLDYRYLYSCNQGPPETRSCFTQIFESGNIGLDITLVGRKLNPEKVLYFLTKQDFSSHALRESSNSKKLDYSFLKSFIGSDSLDHIEMVCHNNSVLICNKLTKTIYSYVKDADYWKLLSKIESSEKMITIASINLPIDSE